MKQTSPIEPARPGLVPRGAALLAVLLTAGLGLLAPPAAQACPDSEAPCPSDKAVEAAQAAVPGAAASQRAVIDPRTGELIVPESGQAEDEASGAASVAGAEAQQASENQARQLAVPGAGIVAPFPLERVNRAVAEVDDEGKATGGCKEGVE